MSYETIADLESVLGDRILIEWEEAPEEYGQTGLKRPENFRQAYYTGVILKLGPLVSPELKVGDRIIFDQFSGVQGFEDNDHRRLAIIEESRQSSCFAVIPPRGESQRFEMPNGN